MERTPEELKLEMHLMDRMVATGLSIEEIASKADVRVEDLQTILNHQMTLTEMILILSKCKPVLGELYNQEPRK